MRNMEKEELQMGKKEWENQIKEDIADSVKETWGWSLVWKKLLWLVQSEELKEGTRKGLASSKSDFKYCI